MSEGGAVASVMARLRAGAVVRVVGAVSTLPGQIIALSIAVSVTGVVRCPARSHT